MLMGKEQWPAAIPAAGRSAAATASVLWQLQEDKQQGRGPSCGAGGC